MAAPLVSVIIDCFYRRPMVEQSVRSVLDQSWDRLELILVDNAAQPDVRDYLDEVAAADRRVKIYRFEENQFSWDDPMKLVASCYNAGLSLAEGELVWYQSYDDYIAPDYLEKMAGLFADNPECLTAAGLPVGVDAEGRRLNDMRSRNQRPRYCDGRTVALDYLAGGRMLGAPGTIFTIRRDALVKAGGYHRAVELSQLLGIAAFGPTGYDETAEFYWRQHPGQLNKAMTERGDLYLHYYEDLIAAWDLHGRWCAAFGPAVADEMLAAFRRIVADAAARTLNDSVATGRLATSRHILDQMRRHTAFPFGRSVGHDLLRRHRHLAATFLTEGPLAPVVGSMARYMPALARRPSIRRMLDRQAGGEHT